MNKEIEPEPQVSFFKSCVEAIDEYREKPQLHEGQIVTLDREQGLLAQILLERGLDPSASDHIDVYNPSIPFLHHGLEYMAGRVELSGKAAEHDSTVVFFVHQGERWLPLKHPVFSLQDPNVTWIDGQMILSGVELAPGRYGDDIEYRSVFYSGDNFQNLERLAQGPWGMKGIRLCKLADGRIGIYSRPQGKIGDLGQIGFTTTESLEEFSQRGEVLIDQAPLLDTRFPKGEWGGVNQVLPLPDGRNVLIGHRAYRDQEDNRHYLPWACLHDPFTGEVIDLGILTERKDFPAGPTKAPDLEDVLYTAGLIERDGKWFLIVGLSDTQTGMIEVAYPWTRVR